MRDPCLFEKVVTVKLQALAYGGDAVGVTLSPEPLQGKKALVRGGVPGETVLVEVEKDKKSLLVGRVKELLSPSSRRSTPPCPYFGVCGGCTLQHIELGFQRELKVGLAGDTLEHQARLDLDDGVSLLGEGLPGTAYRGRITLQVSNQGKIGFIHEASHEVVDIDTCLLARPLLNATLKELRIFASLLAGEIERIILEEFEGRIYVNMMRRDGSVSFKKGKLSRKFLPLAEAFPNLKITHTQEGRILFEQRNFLEVANDAPPLPCGHFSQVNPQGNEILRKLTQEWAQGERITDLYSGSGNLSLALAAEGKWVDAVETDRILVEYGRRLVLEKGVHNISFHNITAEEYAKVSKIQGTVIMDPPRAGAKNVIPYLSADGIDRVIYISCNLPTFARDLRMLEQRGFRIRRLFFIDMFPQTHHLELCAIL